MVQGVQGDTAEQASENEDTDELFDIPAVSYSSKNKAIITLWQYPVSRSNKVLQRYDQLLAVNSKAVFELLSSHCK